MARENKSNCLLDFSQVQEPLNKLSAIFNFSLPPLTLRNRDFPYYIQIFILSGWHKTPGRTTWEITDQSFEWCHYTEKNLSGKANEETQQQPKLTLLNSKNICIILNTFWRTASTNKIVQVCLHRKEVILKRFWALLKSKPNIFKWSHIQRVPVKSITSARMWHFKTWDPASHK